MPPLVSVVIPSYNHATYIGEAIESVLTQTYPNVELVVVDDGSTDNSRNVVRSTLEHAPSGKRFKLVEQANSGAHAAIMRGIAESKGSLIAILNSDDFYYPSRLEVMVEEIRNEKFAFAISKLDFVDDFGDPLPDSSAWREWYEKALSCIESNPTIAFALLEHNFSVTSGNFLFTRALYDRLGGFSSHKFVHDWDFLIRSFYWNEPRFVPAPLMAYRIHSNNTTEAVRKLLAREGVNAIQRYLALFESDDSPNPLAPHLNNWPSFFDRFTMRTGKPLFATFFELNRKRS